MDNLELFTTPYGRDAAALLRERISAAKADDPLAPVAVVVPTNYVGVSTRRLLASGELGPITAPGNGIAGLTLLTVYRLAELLGAPRLAAAGRRPVSTPVIATAVRGVLADDAGVFGPVREHPSTEEALVRSHRELSELRPASLDTLAAQSRRAWDVVRIHRAVRDRLADDWFEEADLMAAACDAVADGSSVVADLGTVFVYLPQDLSLPAADLLRTVAQVAPVEVIAARTGASDADADVDRTLRRVGLEPPATREADPPVATRIVSVSDAEEEVRSAVEAVIAAAREDATALERMAVCYPSPEPYARIVAEQLTAAGIAFNGRAVRPLADRLLGRWLLDLLALPDERYARPAVTSLLAEAPVRTGHGRPVPSGAWERISRDAGVVRDRAEWTDKLRRYADTHRAEADTEAASEGCREWLVERLRRDADHADALCGFLGGLFDDLTRAQRLTRWSKLVAWCHDAIGRYLGGERAHERWPEVEREAAERVEASLDRLAGLDAVEAATDLRVFRRTLQLELDDDLGRVGDFGHGVLVGTPSAALGVDLDVVIVLGLAEGVFPTRPREDSLLPDAERRPVADELRPRAVTCAAASNGRRRGGCWTPSRRCAATTPTSRGRCRAPPRGSSRSPRSPAGCTTSRSRRPGRSTGCGRSLTAEACRSPATRSSPVTTRCAVVSSWRPPGATMPSPASTATSATCAVSCRPRSTGSCRPRSSRRG
ncbi:MAG: hypothetical protein KY462_12695 [Actinobacteria bacterium]|nr:hypothetical protein [Actinomycetota bacterium]